MKFEEFARFLREDRMSALIALADFYDISLDDLVCRKRPKNL